MLYLTIGTAIFFTSIALYLGTKARTHRESKLERELFLANSEKRRAIIQLENMRRRVVELELKVPAKVTNIHSRGRK